MEIRNENENERAVSNLLGSLPHVSPPGDFDVRVRARVARGKSVTSGWSWRPIFAAAVPLCLLLAIGGYFGLRNTETVVENAVVATRALSTPVTAAISQNVAVSNVADPVEPDKLVAKMPVAVDRIAPPARSIETKPAGGSIDRAVTESVPRYPRGLSPNTRSITRPKDFEPSVQMSAKSIFEQLGVDAEYTSSGWKVSGVKANSAAERVGLKAGDVVESINDRTVTERTTFKGNFSGKNMLLSRDGKKIEVDLSKP